MYRLKHIPTGLYYQPCRQFGSHLSTRGKVYQTKSHGLSEKFSELKRRPESANSHIFSVRCEEGSTVHMKTKDILDWKKPFHYSSSLYASTRVADWVLEEIL